MFTGKSLIISMVKVLMMVGLSSCFMDSPPTSPNPSPANNAPPTVVALIPDLTVAENSPPVNNYRDLNDVFSDLEDGVWHLKVKAKAMKL